MLTPASCSWRGARLVPHARLIVAASCHGEDEAASLLLLLLLIVVLLLVLQLVAKALHAAQPWRRRTRHAVSQMRHVFAAEWSLRGGVFW